MGLNVFFPMCSEQAAGGSGRPGNSLWIKNYFWLDVQISWTSLNYSTSKDYQVVQMRYSGALQIKGMQSYKPSKFIRTWDGPLASLEHSDFS